VTLLLSPLEDWGAALERNIVASITSVQYVTGLAPGYYAIVLNKRENECFHPISMAIETSGRDTSRPLEMVLTPFLNQLGSVH
jgi:hypothetical protein